MARIDGSVGKNGYSFYGIFTETIPADYITTNKTNFQLDIYLQNGNMRCNSNNWKKYLKVDGTECYNSTGNNINTTTVGYGEAILVMTVTGSIPHNADGTKRIGIEAYLEKTTSYSSYDPGRCYLYGEVDLTTIPRYVNITSFTVSKRDETSVLFNYGVDANIDYAWYSKDNGASWSNLPANNVISGLSANTSYNFKLRVRRTDSQLTTDSGTYTQSTYDYPYCTSSPNFTVGNALTLSFYNPLGRVIGITGIGADGSTIFSGSTGGTSVTGFNDSGSVDNQYKSLPNDTSGNYQVQVTYGSVVRTRNSGNTYTLDLSKCTPTFNNFTYKDSNTIVTAVTGNDQVLVKGLSNLQISINSANKMVANKYATSKNYIMSIDSISKTVVYSDSDLVASLGTINASGSKRLNIRAYDSRNNSTLAYKDIMVYDYDKPVINASVTRLNNFEAQTTIKVAGTYSRVTIDGTDKNVVTKVQYRYRETGGTWSSWINLATTVEEGNFTCSDVILSLDNTKSFEFEIKAIDNLSDNTETVPVSVGQAIFFISSNKKACYINGQEIIMYDVIEEW